MAKFNVGLKMKVGDDPASNFKTLSKIQKDVQKKYLLNYLQIKEVISTKLNDMLEQGYTTQITALFKFRAFV